MNLEDIFRDALPIINKFAPSVAYALGGSVGAATSFIISLLSNAYSVNPSDLPGLANKIANDPASETILRQLEQTNAASNANNNEVVSKDTHLSSAEINVKLQFEEDKGKSS